MTSEAVLTYAIDAAAPALDLPNALRAALAADAHGSTLEVILAATVEAPGLFFQLDAAGVVARTLHGQNRPLATCRPERAPEGPMPVVPSGQILHLSDFAMARREDGRIALEAPGAWARVVVHDPSLLAVLGALASGCVLDACCRAVPEHSANAVGKLLQLFDWCNLLAHSENAGVFAPHERLMHTRTRLGYHRKPIGKTGQNPVQAETSQPSLEMVALPRLGNEEMPLDTVLRMRRSIRTHGAAPMRKEQLSRFLLRVLAEENGRRSYPSGGGCYPLNGYLAIRLCQDVSAGLYRYLPEKHMLSKVAEDGPGLNQLMKDTAVAAATTEPPQMLLILSADFTRITPAYGDLSYSLVLKEAGAIMQSAALAAAAGGLAACPLGTGNSLLFSRLAGLDPTRETSVAEVMLGAQSQV